MTNFFSYEASENVFKLFGLTHIVSIVLVFVFIFVLVVFRDKIRNSPKEKVIRYIFAITCILIEMSLYPWYLLNGETRLSMVLPLDLCGFIIYVGAIAMLTKKYSLFEVGWFWSFGTWLAIFFNPHPYSIDRFRFYQYMINHALMFGMYVYMFAVLKFRPTINSFKKSILVLVVISPFMYVFNTIIDGNFFLLNNSDGAPVEFVANMSGLPYTLFAVFMGILILSIGNIHYLFRGKVNERSS